ncbi:tetratricopeptide repeat protein [Jatrophihabitans fulvus]
MTDPVIDALRRAVAAAPDDHDLRLHLAEQLIAAGRGGEAVVEAAAVLQQVPDHPAARDAMARALSGGAAPAQPPATAPAQPDRFDWHAAEQEVSDLAGPMFVSDDGADTSDDGQPLREAHEVERASVRLSDVGGMVHVKERLEAAFLAPMRNPQLRALYGKSLRGGLLLYGPPGCGKTFLGRAVAGELGAAFIPVALSDVLDMYIGSSERNVHELFQLARRNAPCVLFLDEVDAIGQRRTQTRNNAIRGATNQLLTELDGVDSVNEGVFVLAATNQPWDVDPALRRPGRFDRTVLVLPPDAPAREQIFRHHLQQRPVERVDLRKLAGSSDGLSGADIAYACELASERALLDSVRTGQPRMITHDDLAASLREVRPSIGPWLDTARNVVEFGDDDGTYAELRAYLKNSKRL